MFTSHRMVSSGILLCLSLLAVVMIGCSNNTSSTTSPLPTAALQTMLDAKTAGSMQVPGALLAVARGEEEWIGVTGEADTAMRAAMQPNLRFRIGSLTKQFTAALILKLAEEGKLTLDDTVRTWLPELQLPYDEKITIRMLLNHTSGVPNYSNATFWDEMVFPHPNRAWQPGELIKLAKAGSSTEPGTVFSYCNTGYILAGMIAEAAAHQSASAAMADRFFTPLGMHDTELAVNGTMSGPFVHGYLQRPGNPTVDDVSTWNPSGAWTAGSIVTTAHDLLLWTKALFGGRVLSTTSLEAMLTPVPPSTAYGLGLGLKQVPDGRTFVFHGGQIPGYHAIIAHHRESGLTVFILTNREDIFGKTNDINASIIDEAVKLLL